MFHGYQKQKQIGARRALVFAGASASINTSLRLSAHAASRKRFDVALKTASLGVKRPTGVFQIILPLSFSPHSGLWYHHLHCIVCSSTMTFADRIIHFLYGLPPPTSGTRNDSMQVLAVGISRSGTDSLREALHVLGVNHTHHGFDTILPPSSLEAIYKLLQKKYTPAPDSTSQRKLTAKDFDTVLLNSVGVSDLFAAEFALELIEAYPKAKVILNVRRDLDDWQTSMQNTMGYYDKNAMDWDWCKSWFSAELFWIRQTMSRTMMPRFFRGSLESNGKWVYKQHTAMIKGLNLPDDQLLEWSVQDGWEPLCKFLGKPIPDSDFPNGNPPKAWAERIARKMKRHHDRAIRNMLIFGALSCVVVGLGCSASWMR